MDICNETMKEMLSMHSHKRKGMTLDLSVIFVVMWVSSTQGKLSGNICSCWSADDRWSSTWVNEVVVGFFKFNSFFQVFYQSAETNVYLQNWVWLKFQQRNQVLCFWDIGFWKSVWVCIQWVTKFKRIAGIQGGRIRNYWSGLTTRDNFQDLKM